jgi:Tfp pilus assembly protein FimT
MTNIPNRQTGLTLLELVIALAAVVILFAIGLPDFDSIAAKRRLQGAAQGLHQDLLFAQSEAIKRNATVRIMFWRNSTDFTDWCYGVTTGEVGTNPDQCDCGNDSRKANCTVDGVQIVRTSDEFPGVKGKSTTFSGNPPRTSFSPPNGTADNGRVVLESAEGVEAEVRVSGLGRVITCSDTSDQKYGFQSCP